MPENMIIDEATGEERKMSKKEIADAAKAERKAAEEAERQAAEKAKVERMIKARAQEAEKQRIEAELEKKKREEKKAKEIANKIKAEADKAAHAEAMAKKEAEEAERKRIADEQAAERKRIREEKQRALDGRARFLASQRAKVAPEGLFEEILDACVTGIEHDFDEYVDEWEGHPVLDQKDQDGWGIEHWLCKKGHVDCLAYLVEKKWWNKHDADPDPQKIVARLEAQDEEGHTLLMFAAAGGHTDVIHYLLGKEVNKDVQSEDGFTALAWAVFNGHLEATQVLVESGAKIGLATRGGKNPVSIANALGHNDIIDWLREYEEMRLRPPVRARGTGK